MLEGAPSAPGATAPPNAVPARSAPGIQADPDGAGALSAPATRDIPTWLLQHEEYEPGRDHDGFIRKSILSITGVLSRFRLDDGAPGRLSPSAPAKLLFGLGFILLTSLSGNYFFVLIMLACVLVRACLLPARALRRVAAVALAAAALTFVIMLPAIFIGQSHSAVLIATKVLISVGAAMEVALTTPFNQLTGALRAFHVPDVVILTVDLALKNIVRLGEVALEVLTALKLRSVGRNRDKRASIGGVGGVVFLKTSEAATATYDAMCCRGFDGQYTPPRERQWRAVDLAWLAAFALLACAFAYLQGAL